MTPLRGGSGEPHCPGEKVFISHSKADVGKENFTWSFQSPGLWRRGAFSAEWPVTRALLLVYMAINSGKGSFCSCLYAQDTLRLATVTLQIHRCLCFVKHTFRILFLSSSHPDTLLSSYLFLTPWWGLLNTLYGGVCTLGCTCLLTHLPRPPARGRRQGGH